MTPEQIVACIDLTELNDEAGTKDIDHLLTSARTRLGEVAALCTWPRLIAYTRQQALQQGLHCQFVAVVNFPHAEKSHSEVAKQISDALQLGADEIDYVIPYQRWLQGDHAWVHQSLAIARKTSQKHILKGILETGALPSFESVCTLATLAIEHDFDFIKTSTGKTPVSATLAAVQVMALAVKKSGKQVGIKPSGGIRSRKDVEPFVEAISKILGEDFCQPQRFRIGTSKLLDHLLERSDRGRGDDENLDD